MFCPPLILRYNSNHIVDLWLQIDEDTWHRKTYLVTHLYLRGGGVYVLSCWGRVPFLLRDNKSTVNQATRQHLSLKESYKPTNTKLQIVEYKVTKNIDKVSFNGRGWIAQLSPALNEARGSCPSKSATSFVFVARSRNSDDWTNITWLETGTLPLTLLKAYNMLFSKNTNIKTNIQIQMQCLDNNTNIRIIGRE